MGLFTPSSYKTRIRSSGHEIVFTNTWQMVPLKTLATLAVDGNVIASSHQLTHADPNVPLISVSNVSGTIQSLEVFVIGITSIKVAISVNDDFVYKDKIGLLDKLQLKLYGGKGI